MLAQNRKRGDKLGVTKQARGAPENALVRAAETGVLSRKLKKYLKSCREQSNTEGKKETARLPTLAGFCAMLGCGTASVAELQEQYPEGYDYVCAVLEDEALNSSRSPALLNAYLKERFRYGEKIDTEGVLQPIFEHDILEDGT